MATISPGKTANAIDRNAVSPDRTRRNWQRLTNGTSTQLVSVDGTTIAYNAAGQLTIVDPITINETPGDQGGGTYILSNVPVNNSLMVFVNGLEQMENVDYTVNVSARTFTFHSTSLLEAGDEIIVTYRAQT